MNDTKIIESVNSISVVQLEKIIYENKYYNKINDRLNLIGKQHYYNLKFHGINHAYNVALFVLLITYYTGIDDDDINLIIDAALLHDIGKVDDYEDFNHGFIGAKIAYNLKKNDKYYDSDKLNLLKAIICGHCKDVFNNNIPNNYGIVDIVKYRKLLKVLKDADILDRTRLFNVAIIDFNEINYDISKKLFLYSEKINNGGNMVEKLDLNERLILKINDFLSKYRSLLTKEEFIDIKKKILFLKKQNIKNYSELKEFERTFLKYYNKVWKNSMSSFDDYDGISDFKFLITSPTVKSENYNIKDTISAVMISNKHMGTFNKIPYGIVLEIGDNSILGISENDMHSIVVDKNDHVESYFNINSFGNKKIYSKRNVVSLKSPDEIEMSLIRENIKKNGNVLVRGDASVYCDILLRSDDVKMAGIVVIEPCCQDDMAMARKLAETLNLKIKSIPIHKYYEKLGINNQNKIVNEYDLYDIGLIESIPDKLTVLCNESSNLFVQRIGKNFYIKSDESNDYLFYNTDKQEIEVVIKDDDRLIKVIFNNPISYLMDGVVVTKSEIEKVLSDVKQSKHKKH